MGILIKTLGEVCSVYTGEQLNKTVMLKQGYPVINGGVKESGYTDKYNELENTITISQGGASAGFVNFVLDKFFAGAHCYVIKPKIENLNNRFLYFFLKYREYKIMNLKNGAGIPGLSKNKITQFLISIPPLEKQKEIVSILDKFDTLINSLKEGIPREIELRRMQYEYYRDKLLTFNDIKNKIN